MFRLECCCYNCATAAWYLQETKGAEAPPCPPCMDSNWFANDFTVVQGEESLRAFRLFEGADTTRVYCDKCATVLMADHPAYGGKVIVTQSTNYKSFTALEGAELGKPQSRHFLKDLSEKEVSQLSPWEGNPNEVYQGVSDTLMAAFPGMMEAGGTGEMNIQKLIEQVGVTIPEDHRERLQGGPPTLMQQAAAAAKKEAVQ